MITLTLRLQENKHARPPAPMGGIAGREHEQADGRIGDDRARPA